ncbi:phosphoribosylanthranilate isomerase [Roseovarius atlanticus]|uniref:Phosphoribosylanthranilate isomerase n=1 Tax=Roseovarius atlanticus TaxID=1641875 RepID=A0A0T5NW20_9RHOB|nr:lipopolysaccharide assembly protein LapA domain-containing protein [Roseovarius atlanticus]KRS13130.1 phosphoribosylanthranilate isomerase [Roseovarius atlanticus]
MRYIRYASIAIFALALILIALANRQVVEVQILPSELGGMAAVNPSYQLPLFLVMFGGILAGLVIGFIWEWIREAKERAAAARQAREMQRLRAEVRRLKGERNKDQDEVLALLDEAS